jgi:hypothetical protein
MQAVPPILAFKPCVSFLMRFCVDLIYFPSTNCFLPPIFLVACETLSSCLFANKKQHEHCSILRERVEGSMDRHLFWRAMNARVIPTVIQRENISRTKKNSIHGWPFFSFRERCVNSRAYVRCLPCTI